jgi:ankyrin repeat protein
MMEEHWQRLFALKDHVGLLGDTGRRLGSLKDLLSMSGDDEMGEFGGDSPLHIAVMGRDYDTVQQLLENNANVNSQNLRGRTPLFTACCSSNVRAVEMLLAAGADPGIATKLDFNCLHISCREGFAGFV